MNLKKCLAALSVIACTFGLFSIGASAQTGVVTADVLNIRSSTYLTSEVIEKAYKGQELEVLASDGSWYKILLSSFRVGYVKSEYLTLNPAYHGVVTATNLIVRSSTGINSPAITTIPYGSVVELLAYDGYWYQISYNNGQKGYVSADYISLDLSLAVISPYVAYGYISATSLNIREHTDFSSNVITALPMGSAVKLLTYDGTWYKVSLNDGREGYASAQYISSTPVAALIPESAVSGQPTASDVVYTQRPAASAPTDEVISFGKGIVQSSYRFLGLPYVWAAEGPESFDCSGFTMYVMNLNGIQIPHQSGMQYNYGASVEKDNLIPGDLVFFSSANTNNVAHVGIYIGDGNFIHASSGSAKSVTISPLSANYYTKHYLGARRLF